MKILISGGHLTPALATIEHILEREPNWQLVFVGREYAREESKQPSAEKSEVTALKVPFIPFTTGKLSSYGPLAVLTAIGQTVTGFFRALQIMLQEKPDLFLSFGSYLAVPLAYAAWLCGVPIITHEQTRTVGMATRLISPIAQTIAVSYAETAPELLSRKVVVTGNPLRKELLTPPTRAPQWYTQRTEKPILYITGGSQGSEVINSTVSQALARLTKDWSVIHQCGRASSIRSYLTELESVSATLPARQRSAYVVREWLTVTELAWVYTQATAVAGRAGANTVQELATFQVPSVVIPLPFSHHQEQQKNAEWLASTGGAVVLPQKDLNPETLIAALTTIAKKPTALKRKLSLLTNTSQDATEKLYDCIQKTLKV